MTIKHWIYISFNPKLQSLSRVQLFATPWIAARQASLSITNSRSSLKLTPIESVMPSSHLILCRPLLLQKYSRHCRPRNLIFFFFCDFSEWFHFLTFPLLVVTKLCLLKQLYFRWLFFERDCLSILTYFISFYPFATRNPFKNVVNRNFPGGPAIETSSSNAAGWVWSLVRALRYHMPRSVSNTWVNKYS